MTRSTESNVPVRIAVVQTTAIAYPDHNLRIARDMVSEAPRGNRSPYAVVA